MRLSSVRFFIAIAFLCACTAPFAAAADVIANQQTALQAQLDEINKEITQNQSQLATEQKQRTSLERDVSILDSQIAEAQLEIKQRDLTIQQINNGIAQKQSGINSLDSQVAAGEASVAQLLRETNEMDRTSLAARVLGGTLPDFFTETDDFSTIQKALADAFTTMAAQRSDLSARKSALQEQNQEQSDLLQLQVAQRNSLKATEKQKQDLVAAAKGQEAVYQQIIAGKQQTAAQIKAALFSLNNGSHSTSFGDMYQYAKEASVSAISGVSPAFILAILTEESDLGQNVGNCTYENAMSPKRDIPDYLELMQQLGLSPDSEKVSCAQGYGAYGGAMGPAQFIPSTWMLYQGRVAQASGQSPPNPWDPRTAVFATAIYMSDLGADAQTAAAERRAALRYLAGSHWSNPAYAFYWTKVSCFENQYQYQIDVLNNVTAPPPLTDCTS